MYLAKEDVSIKGKSDVLGGSMSTKIFGFVFAVLCITVAMGNDKITCYRDINYKGKSVSYGVGMHDWGEIRKNAPGDDDISSVKVPQGLKVTLAEHPKLQGRKLVFLKDEPNLVNHGFNDVVSSLKVERIHPNRNGVTLCNGKNWSGEEATIAEGEHDASATKSPAILKNNAVQALFVPKGYTVILYSEKNFAGNSLAFSAQSEDCVVNDLKEIFKNVRSIMVTTNN